MEKPHVLIIDDGVNPSTFGFELFYDLEIFAGSSPPLPRHGHPSSSLTHGTLCAGVVHALCPSCHISSIKILNETTHKTRIDLLASALRWCIEHPPMIINMSLGSTDFRDFDVLAPLVGRLSESSILVAALANSGFITWPASMSGVIGVQCLPEQSPQSPCLTWRRIDGVDVLAPGLHTLRTINGSLVRTDRTNSYAAPYVTGLLCQHFHEIRALTTHAAKQFLAECLLEQTRLPPYYLPDWIQSATVVSDKDFPLEYLPFQVEKFLHFHPVTSFEDIHSVGNSFSNTDTLVFVWSRKEFRDVKLRLAHQCLIPMNLAVVDYHYQPDDHYLFPRKTQKIWLSHLWKPTLVDIKSPNEEVPIIIFYDDNFNHLIKSCQQFFAEFARLGYHAAIFTNDPLSPLYNMGFIPYLSKPDYSFLHSYCTVHKADLIIYGINTHMINKLVQNQSQPDIDCQIIFARGFKPIFYSEAIFSHSVSLNDNYHFNKNDNCIPDIVQKLNKLFSEN